MTQPGVYFTLDAPFVSIIGLYTNVLEGPGVLDRPERPLPGAEGRPAVRLAGRRAEATGAATRGASSGR